MRRTEIDRWTAKRARSSPRPKGFLIRRGDLDVETFQVSEHADVSSFCKPGDVILAIMPEDSVGLTYRVEDMGAEPAPAVTPVVMTENVIKVVGEQISRAYDGIVTGYETLLTSFRDDLREKAERIGRLEDRLERNETKTIEVLRFEHEQKIEESKLRHSQVLTEEYLGRAFSVLDQVVDGFVKHHSRRDKLKGIFEKLKPETLQAIMGDLSQDDVNELLTIADELDKSEAFSSCTKKLSPAGE